MDNAKHSRRMGGDDFCLQALQQQRDRASLARVFEGNEVDLPGHLLVSASDDERSASTHPRLRDELHAEYSK